MKKLKLLIVFSLASAFILCGCSPASPATAESSKTTGAPMVTGNPNTTQSPVPEQSFTLAAREDWNLESRLFADIEYLEDDGYNGKGFCIRYEIKDLDNLGFYYEALGGGLEYFNGTEWEVIVPYQHRDRKVIVFPQKESDHTLFQEAIVIRRWGERLPDGKYRYVKLVWDGSTPRQEEAVKIEFEIQKTE